MGNFTFMETKSESESGIDSSKEILGQPQKLSESESELLRRGGTEQSAEDNCGILADSSILPSFDHLFTETSVSFDSVDTNLRSLKQSVDQILQATESSKI